MIYRLRHISKYIGMQGTEVPIVSAEALFKNLRLAKEIRKYWAEQHCINECDLERFLPIDSHVVVEYE